MVKWQRTVLFLVMILGLAPVAAMAGGLTRDLNCDTAFGAQPKYVERASSAHEAFSADPQSNTIFVNPRAMTTRAQPVVNYEFALACLRIAREPDDMCSVVRFMRGRSLLFSEDLEVLQNYFVARARQTKSAQEKDAYFSRIKDLYSCF